MKVQVKILKFANVIFIKSHRAIPLFLQNPISDYPLIQAQYQSLSYHIPNLTTTTINTDHSLSLLLQSKFQQQRMQNNQAVQKFYQQVFEDFKNRLFIAYRFKSTISSEQIDKFSKIVKEKLHKKRQLFETGIRLSLQKRSPESKLPSLVLSNGSKVKIQQDAYGNYDRNKTIIQHQHQSDQSSPQDQQSDDDLKQFNKPKQPQPEVKKEEPEEKRQAQEDNDSEEMYEEEDRKKEEILSKSEKKICAHIIASYGTKNKKHIPKVEKTKIELENVFIRTAEKELFYNKITCDLEQAVYNNIKL